MKAIVPRCATIGLYAGLNMFDINRMAPMQIILRTEEYHTEFGVW